EHPAFQAVARGGFVMSGIVHALIGAIALRMAFGGSSENADQSGALQAIASAPGGNILLWIGGIAMAALALWHLAEAWFGARASSREAKKRVWHVVKALGKAVVYAALAVTSLRFAAGAGSDSGEQTSSMTAGLMGSAGGRAAVVAVGLVGVVIGFAHVYIGASRRVADQLRVSRGQIAAVARAADQRGGPRVREFAGASVATAVRVDVAEGTAMVGVGLGFGWAVLGAEPEKATGLDGAPKTMADLPAGSVVLAIIG